MRLDELVTFVRQLDLSPTAERQRPREPHREPQTGRPRVERIPGDDPNAIPVERPPVPPWITDSVLLDVAARDSELVSRDGHSLVFRDDGSMTLTIEQEISTNDIPRDVGPNPPIDVLAYYLPFHLYGANWGVYIRESGILFAATIIKGAALSPSDTWILQKARCLLFDHERFHFQAEVACARAEVVVGYRLYDPYFSNGFAAAHEEALANATAYRPIKKAKSPIPSRVTVWMKSQGPGYCDFERWISPVKFAAGCRLASQYMLSEVPTHSPRQPAEFLFDSMRSRPPVYFVLDVSKVRVSKAFPKWNGMQVQVFSNDHPPPHIHLYMPPESLFTRLEWPTLQPLEGDRELSAKQRRKLSEYIAKNETKIDLDIRKTYGPMRHGSLARTGSTRSASPRSRSRR